MSILSLDKYYDIKDIDSTLNILKGVQIFLKLK